MPTLEPWTCDVCYQPITNVQTGYVIWRHEADGMPQDFKIIHQSQCDSKRFQSWSSKPLGDFLGTDGLNFLLSFLSLGPIALGGLTTGNSRRVQSLDEFVDFVRRLQIPGYERLRQHVGDPDLHDELDGANEYQPYGQETLGGLQRDGLV